MQSQTTVDEVIALARRLSPLEKLKLIERLAPDLETALSSPAVAAPSPRRSVRGMFRGCTVSSQDIEQARGEIWGSFPRKDF
ncbi:MAG: hypothetical protein JWL69_3626 [Phycisphaerales bacterium]|nr:hypothetical protein [Phycisphaerales bacterium]